MGLFGRLFLPLIAVLAAAGIWLAAEHERDTVFAVAGRDETAPGAHSPAAGPVRPDPSQPVTQSPERPARERFARAFDKSDARPRVAVIVTGLGLARDTTFRAIEETAPEVTLAFSPYADNLAPLVDRARERGHEILLAAPMEPADVRRRDAGPAALTVNHSESATRRRLNWMLGRVPSHVGIIGDLGDRFARDAVAMRPVFDEIAAKGLLYIENRLEMPEPGSLRSDVPAAAVTVWLDRDLSGDAVDREIAAAEAQARSGGSVVALARPYPLTLARIAAWMKTFDGKSLVAAPVSAVVKGGL